mmetsp:Transcript_4632/g.18863  ORF Transcript_4632/g.18863 Transcript_4632/m.18863 type:complete len:165 (+) Transcript_4632:798-1292(+)
MSGARGAARSAPRSAGDRAKGLLSIAAWIPLAAGYKVEFGRVRRLFGNCGTLTLMHHLFPYALAVQLLLVPLVDPPGLWTYRWTPTRVAAILASGVAAFLVNYSGFLVVGHPGLGALAHQLLGQFKAAGTVVIAAVVFAERYSVQELLAAAGAMLGIFAYSYCR